MTITTLSRASSIRRTGPIGMQPCVRAVATETPGASISPATPLLPRPSSPGVGPGAGLDSGATRDHPRDRRRSPPRSRRRPSEHRDSAGRHGPAPRRAGSPRSSQHVSVAGPLRDPGCGEDTEVVRRQRRGHHHCRRLFKDFGRRRAHSEPDPTDPGAQSRYALSARRRSPAQRVPQARLYTKSQCRSIHDGRAATSCAARVAGSPVAEAAANRALKTGPRRDVRRPVRTGRPAPLRRARSDGVRPAD